MDIGKIASVINMTVVHISFYCTAGQTGSVFSGIIFTSYSLLTAKIKESC